MYESILRMAGQLRVQGIPPPYIARMTLAAHAALSIEMSNLDPLMYRSLAVDGRIAPDIRVEIVPELRVDPLLITTTPPLELPCPASPES
jgi:hypothetical protein